MHLKHIPWYLKYWWYCLPFSLCAALFFKFFFNINFSGKRIKSPMKPRKKYQSYTWAIWKPRRLSGVIKLMHDSWYYLPVRYCLYLNKVELYKWSPCVSKFIHMHNGLVTPGISSLDCCKSLTSSRFITQRPLGKVQNLLSRGSAISGRDLGEFWGVRKKIFQNCFSKFSHNDASSNSCYVKQKYSSFQRRC